jgi:serine/threonine protein kinase
MCDGPIPDKYGSHFKLVDFDNARFFGSKKLPLLPQDQETLLFYPPELLLQDRRRAIDGSSDIWSLGILIMRLMSCNFLYIDSLANAPNLDKFSNNYEALAEAVNSDLFSYSLQDFLF